MLFFLIKIILSGVIIAVASEVSKRSSLFGGIIVALPLVSILSLCWLYFETRDLEKVSSLSYSILWFVIPSLGFFVFLPWMMKLQFGFIFSMTLACLATASLFYGFSKVLDFFGIKFQRRLPAFEKTVFDIVPSPSLTGDKKHRLRVDRYRVLYEIHDRILSATIVKVAHRKEAYLQKNFLAGYVSRSVNMDGLPKKKTRTRSDSNALSHALHTQRFLYRQLNPRYSLGFRP